MKSSTVCTGILPGHPCLLEQRGRPAVTCRGEAPPSCLRKTVRSLKSPTGAFIAPLRCANASLPRGRRNRLITPPTKRNRAFPTGNALLYISLSYVDFCRVRPAGRTLFFSWKTLRLLPILESGCHSNRQSCGNLLKCSAVGYV